MPVCNSPHVALMQSIDMLFTGLDGDAAAYTPLPRSHAGPTFPALHPRDVPVRPLEFAPSLPPEGDPRAAYEWLANEKRKLEEYTRGQFDMIQQQHQALLAKHFRSEEALALRAQDLNREMQFLASQSEALQRRAHELAEHEMMLNAQMEKLARAQEELIALENNSESTRRDIDAQQQFLNELREETAQLQRVGQSTRTEFSDFEATLKERQQAWEKKQAEFVARQAQMEQRYAALDKAEEAHKRRMAELDELEDQLRREFEQSERALATERREMETLRARLRLHVERSQNGRGTVGQRSSLA
jgi:chromosome segregation ATPase